ncbi:putative KilA-N domain-containing protein [Megavirus lba]|uniref:Putative KilA-N domain-containing protein n=1 Tax=Megavirus lba TaxID=1235314 RepID=L7Y632_9VIRU|nr:putative KilA-N domain-containing protein [Megavirus lba]
MTQNKKISKKISGSKTTKPVQKSNKLVKKKHDIRNISYKEINDKYSWGRYGSFKVIIMKENGYINATKLIHLASDKKKLNDWTRGKQAEEYITELSCDTGLTAAEILIPITTSSKNLTEIRGTYCHPDLIPHIAAWASPPFAMRVSKIVNNYLTNKIVKEKEKLIKKKDNKIDKLNNKVDELLVKNNKMDKRIKRLLVKNDELYDQNEEILGKVDFISNERVVSTGSSENEHMLVIIKNNDDPEEYEEDENIYQYHALRVMKRSYKTRLASHRARHPNMEILMRINYSPNSVNLWTRIKNNIASGKKRKIEASGSKFNFKRNYTEQQLKKDIMSIHNERLNTDDID